MYYCSLQLTGDSVSFYHYTTNQNILNFSEMQGTSLEDFIKNKSRQKPILIHTPCHWPTRSLSIFQNILDRNSKIVCCTPRKIMSCSYRLIVRAAVFKKLYEFSNTQCFWPFVLLYKFTGSKVAKIHEIYFIICLF